MKKRFKRKYRIKKILLFNLFIIIFSFYFTLNILIKNEYETIDFIFKTNRNDFLDGFKKRISSPSNIIYNSLNKSVKYSSISVFNENKDIYFDYDNALSEYIYEGKTNNIDNKNVLVYIYNTHQLEEYKSDEANTLTPNVMLASYSLKDKLSKNGINSIVETASIKSYLNKYKMSYLESYDASRYYIFKTLKKNKDIMYVIDIHRDSIKHKLSTITYNGKKYARVLFVVGLGNKNNKYNLKLANKLNKSFNNKVSGISRGVVKYDGDETNAVYNQDTHKNAFLIEIGGYQNTMEEVNNTVDVLTDILTEYIRSENA